MNHLGILYSLKMNMIVVVISSPASLELGISRNGC